MSLYALLKNFASAVMDRAEADIHEAATALHEHFEAKVVAPVEKEAAKVEAVPAAALAEMKAEVVATTEEVTK
jgi:hypothetical protein